MQTVLIVIHLMIVAALVVVVLLQRSEGGALGMGGGGGFMTGRGQANVLTRATSILAALFFATSLGLTLLARYGHQNKLDLAVPAGPSQTAPALPPTQPNSVLDQLRAIEKRGPGGAPDAPAPAKQGATTQGATTQGATTQTPAATPAPATPAPSPATTPAPAEPSGMPARTAPDAAPPPASPTK